MRYRADELPPEVASKLTDAQRMSLGLAALLQPADTPSASPGATADERLLHNEILEHCRMNGLLAFHGSMAHRTCRTVGEPDFVILCPGGRVLLIECKSKTGKLSPEQLGVGMWAEKLGHKIHVVRSYVEFLKLYAEL
jgi:hypothetical protein